MGVNKKKVKKSKNKRKAVKKKPKSKIAKETKKSSGIDWYSIYAKIRLWFQPYWKPKRPIDSQAKTKTVKETDDSKKKKKKKVKEKHWTEYLEPSQKHDTYCKVITYPEVIKPFKMKNQPAYDTIWCYHSNEMHQVYGHFKPKAGFRYNKRDDKKRKQLKPLIFPMQDKPFDRTHLIPIGYHNSENDRRLLIGWDSQQNRGPFNKFEQRQKKRQVPIYWLTEVVRTPVGAKWKFTIFSEEGAILDSLETEMISKFIWQS